MNTQSSLKVQLKCAEGPKFEVSFDFDFNNCLHEVKMGIDTIIKMVNETFLLPKGVLNVNLSVRQNSSQIFPRQKIVKNTLHKCYRSIIMLNSFN